MDDLASKIHQLGLADTIVLMGNVDDPRPLLAGLDIFAMPSLSEGLGVAALEAMAMGLPVIASAVGGLREVVQDGVSGYLCGPDDARALARIIAELAQDPARRLSVGSAARQRAMAEFSLEAMGRGTCDVYQELLTRSEQLAGGGGTISR
jgi:glycosyltransferase involved in cell wall biosynthesis